MNLDAGASEFATLTAGAAQENLAARFNDAQAKLRDSFDIRDPSEQRGENDADFDTDDEDGSGRDGLSSEALKRAAEQRRGAKRDRDGDASNDKAETREKRERSASQKEEWDEALFKRAAELGITKKELQEEFESPAEAKRHLATASRILGAYIQRQQSQATEQNRQTAAPTGNASAQADDSSSKSDGASAKASPFKFQKVEIDAEQYGDPALKTLGDNVNGMYEHFSGQIEQTLKRIEALSKNIGQVAGYLKMQEFDQRVTGLGEDYHELLGAGSSSSLREGTDQFTNRRKLVQHYQQLLAAQAIPGREKLSEDELFDMAVMSAFRTHHEEMTAKKATARMRDRHGKFVAGTSRQRDDRTPNDKGRGDAVRTAAAKMRAFGVLNDL